MVPVHALAIEGVWKRYSIRTPHGSLLRIRRIVNGECGTIRVRILVDIDVRRDIHSKFTKRSFDMYCRHGLYA